MGRRGLGLLALVLCCTCGGSTSDANGSGGSGASSGASGSSGKGGSGGAAGSVATGGSSGAPIGGAGGGVGGGGFSGTSGTSGASGTGAAGAAGAGACAGLSYCDCKANSGCKPIVETCFCPCGIEPCEPPCTCACGGGAYLGCSVTGMDPFEKFMGTWLIGWSGGMNHYSWVRLEPDGVARVLDGATLTANLPFWNCNGVGSWHLAAKPETIALYFPTGCDPAFQPLTFLNMVSGPSYPKGATVSATVELSPTQTVEGYKFPHAQCDAALTTCTDPFI